MVMNLKPALRHQLREYLIGGLVVWLVNVAIIVLCFIGFLSFDLGDNGVISYNGCGIACAIFAFVYGITLPRQSVRLCAQMGVSRRTAFLSLLLTTVLGSFCLAVATEVLLSCSRLAARALYTGEQLFGLFPLIYPDYSAGPSLHILPVLYSAAAMVALFAFGLFFTFLFWRLNKTGCIIAALAIPVLLTGVPSLLMIYDQIFAPVIALFLKIGRAFLASPWNAMALFLAAALVFILISWFLIRRTNIRGGALSQK